MESQIPRDYQKGVTFVNGNGINGAGAAGRIDREFEDGVASDEEIKRNHPHCWTLCKYRISSPQGVGNPLIICKDMLADQVSLYYIKRILHMETCEYPVVARKERKNVELLL